MKSLHARILRLEKSLAAATTIVYGWVFRLDEDYTGERHTVYLQRLISKAGYEWFIAEERKGPPPHPYTEDEWPDCTQEYATRMEESLSLTELAAGAPCPPGPE